VRFCPQCGAPVVIGARFCVECGESLAGPEIASSTALAAPRPPGGSAVAIEAEPAAQALGPFAAIFGAILVVGAAVAWLIMRQLPARDALLASSAQSAQQPAPAGDQLPPGHPKAELPKEARDFIAGLDRKARANSTDIASWDRLGDVCLRAATFDPEYYPKASAAYAHVLKLDPDNLDALRGVGNIDFDQRHYDEAIAAYEHYLSRKPEDPDVRTDLGTMLLSSGVADQAVYQYKKVIETHPKFFEAYFNLGIAYGEMNNLAAARAAFQQALKLAPDSGERGRVNQMIASLDSASSAPEAPAADNPARQVAQAAAAPNTFHGAMERMFRDLPVAGPKVESVRWTSANNARVLMDNFPMDQMPPFAAAKFMSDLKAGIDRVKSEHQVAGAITVELCDSASGRVMQSVTE
jgi:cytochrome c-type biogenesis protein CcmH/NrfG